MAFTAPNTTDFFNEPGHQDQIVAELIVALHERQGCIGQAETSFPTISGALLADTTWTCIGSLRTAIAALVGTGNNVFVQSDGTSTYANIAAALTAAGHSGGWITDYSKTNKAIWTQFQDVFGVLKKYRRSISPTLSYSSSNFNKYASTSGTIQDAWDACIAASPGNTALVLDPSLLYVQWYCDTFEAPDPDNAQIVVVPHRGSYGSGMIGSLTKLIADFNVRDAAVVADIFSTDYTITSGSNSTTGALHTLGYIIGGGGSAAYTHTHTWTGSLTLDGSSLIYSYARTTSIPATPVEGWMGIGIDSTVSGPNIWADATTGLTYG